MTSKRDARPDYQRVTDALREVVLEQLAPGDRIPSYAELAHEYGVSPTTAQKAVRALKREGLLQGRRGKAVFVRRPGSIIGISSSYVSPSPDGGWTTWKKEAEKQGMVGSERLVFAGRIRATDEVVDALALTSAAEVVVRRRVMYLDGDPVQTADSYYPLEIAAGTPLEISVPIRGGAPAHLAHLGFRSVECDETLLARMPTPEEVETLDIPEGVPIIRLARITKGADGGRLEYCVMTMIADRHRLTYTLPIQS